MTSLFAHRFAVPVVDDVAPAPELRYDEERGLTLTREGRVFVEAAGQASSVVVQTETAIKAEGPDATDAYTVTLTEVRGEPHDPEPDDFMVSAHTGTDTRVRDEHPDSPAAVGKALVTLTEVHGEREDPDPDDLAVAHMGTHTKAGAEDPDIPAAESLGFDTRTSIDHERPDHTAEVLLKTKTYTLVHSEGVDVTHDLGGPEESLN